MKPLIITALLFILLVGCKVEKTDNGGNGDGNGDGNDDNPITVFYVSTEGDNSNDGSKDSPWLTIQHGLNNLQPGHTLNITPGTYNETLYFNRSGNQGSPITVKGESATNTFVDGINVERDLLFVENSNYIEISDLFLTRAPRAGLRLSNSDNITIRRCVIGNNGRWGIFTDFSDNTTIDRCEVYGSAAEHGIYISNSSDNALVRNNIVHHNYASGIQINADPSMGGDGISSNCVIENNFIFENGIGGGAAINLASVRDSVIRNNMIYLNYAGGIAAWDDGQGFQWGCSGLDIFHNSIYFRPEEGRWAISLKNGSINAEIANNILAGGRRGGFEFNASSISGIFIDYNIYYRFNSVDVVCNEDDREFTLAEWRLNGYDTYSRSSLPQVLFAEYTGTDYHLAPGSEAIDSGLNVGLLYDFEGDARPNGVAPDIGADEYSGN